MSKVCRIRVTRFRLTDPGETFDVLEGAYSVSVLNNGTTTAFIAGGPVSPNAAVNLVPPWPGYDYDRVRVQNGSAAGDTLDITIQRPYV